jgi:hypothetical protein
MASNEQQRDEVVEKFRTLIGNFLDEDDIKKHDKVFNSDF